MIRILLLTFLFPRIAADACAPATSSQFSSCAALQSQIYCESYRGCRWQFGSCRISSDSCAQLRLSSDCTICKNCKWVKSYGTSLQNTGTGHNGKCANAGPTPRPTREPTRPPTRPPTLQPTPPPPGQCGGKALFCSSCSSQYTCKSGNTCNTFMGVTACTPTCSSNGKDCSRLGDNYDSCQQYSDCRWIVDETQSQNTQNSGSSDVMKSINWIALVCAFAVYVF
mmetsp:Transcript_13900/g.20517  ORF Transcript_13900/g.20517 Transcript_13900/m.20517 type:complete len:225 (+) Transcript_13900:351-1025(+)